MDKSNVTTLRPKDKKDDKSTLSESLSPREIVSELDRFVVGQDKAKRAVAIALRNRWRRQAIEGEMKDEVLPKNILMMGNHGVTVVAPTVALAFDELYHLERACETLVTAYTTGKELKVVSSETANRTSQDWQDFTYSADLHFAELRNMLNREEPGYCG